MQTHLVRAVRQAVLLATLALVVHRPLAAQVTETPVPFDRAGTVRSVSPPLALRLGLGAPTWPVRDDFVEARLYAISNDGYVIAVQRKDGRMDRYALSAAEVEVLRGEVTSTMTRVGRVVGEEGANNISEPAGSAFVRNQMVLSALLYAPALATLTHDPSVGTALYLASIGGSYFAVSGISKRTTITKAQNTLATDAALRLPAMLFGAYHTFGVSPNGDLGAATALVGGIGGSILGYRLGRGLTPSEAASMTFGSTLTGLTALGVGGTAGMLEHDSFGRGAAAMTVAGGIVGYAAGPLYPRRVSYTVTSGDVGMLGISGLLGVMVAGTPLTGRDHADSHLVSGMLTAGMLGGVFIGDRVFVRPFDHTDSEAGLVTLGAVAGGLMGAAIPVLAQSENATAMLASVTVGALVGTVAAENLVNPRGAGETPRRVGSGPSRLRIDPGALALAAAGRPGTYSVLRLTF